MGKMNLAKQLLSFVLASTVSQMAFGNETKTVKPHKNIPLFKSTEVLQLVIKSNFPSVNVAYADQEVKHDGSISYKNKSGKLKNINVQLSARGGGRASWCDFAPIKLILPKKVVKEDGKKSDPLKKTIFKNSKRKLKLVTHCNPNSHRNSSLSDDDFVVTEYLLYKLVEAAGFPHFKTRLARAKYLDNNGYTFTEGYLIILENFNDLAQRYKSINLSYLISEGKTYGRISKRTRVAFDISLRLAMNEIDHDFGGIRNITVFGRPNGKGGYKSITQAPYDFVYSPKYFPYGLDMKTIKNQDTNVDWFKNYEIENPDLKKELRKQAKILVKNHDKLLDAINSVPYSAEGKVVKERVLSWMNSLVWAAKQYLN